MFMFSLVMLMYPVFVGSVMFLFLGKEDRKIDSVTVFLTLCVIFVVVMIRRCYHSLPLSTALLELPI